MREMRGATSRLNHLAADPFSMEGQTSFHHCVKFLEETQCSDESALDVLRDQLATVDDSLSRLRSDVAGSQLLEPVGDALLGRMREVELMLGIDSPDAQLPRYPHEPPGDYPQFLMDDW